MTNPRTPSAAIIGGGPAGLMAAEMLLAGGIAVDLYDAMPSVGRKFLMAGKGGMNITHSEAQADFLARYGERRGELQASLDAFTPAMLRDWMAGLGIESFVGSSGRVFPVGMKAAPLLRAWLHRLRQQGLRLHVRHRWLGWRDGALRFAKPHGEIGVTAAATVLALGGGSWPQLGSDGTWVTILNAKGIAVAPLLPANCGFEVDWSDHFRERYAGQPVKPVAAALADEAMRTGEFVITASGLEGGLIYALSARLRDRIARNGTATLALDLLPQWPSAKVQEEIARPRGARSLANHLQSRLGLTGVKAGLLRECLSREEMANPARLAAAIKSLPLTLTAPRPLAEAISSAGGVSFAGLDAKLMLRRHPGVFCAGEMLDWEAPTGGYLLTACLATGRTAGRGALQWLHG